MQGQYGVWNSGIRVHLNPAMTVIVAIAILHNLAIEKKEPLIDDVNDHTDDYIDFFLHFKFPPGLASAVFLYD